MERNTSVTLGEHLDDFVRVGLCKLEEDEKRLQALSDKLQAGEDSPLVDDFNGEKFIEGLHKEYLK